MHWIEPSETENADTRSSDQELRKQLIAARPVDMPFADEPGRRFPFGLLSA